MKVEIISKENIKPSSSTPHHLKTFKFSMLDQFIPNVYAPILLYYPNHDGNDDVSRALERSAALKKSLSDTLTHFYPLAGSTINENQLSIACDDVGASFVCALVDRRLDEFLSRPEHRLINRFLPFEPGLDGSAPSNRVLNVRVNIFECGGIVLGFCVSHKMFDAAGFAFFLKEWTSVACGGEEVACRPDLNASALFPAKDLLNGGTYVIANYGSFLRKGSFSTRRFVFGSRAIASLKSEAAEDGAVRRPSRVDVVSAFLWKHAMAASKEASGIKKPSLFVSMVSLRRRLSHAALSLGNLIWFSYAVCPANYETTLHGLVNKVRESISKIDTEFVNRVQGDEGHVVLLESLKEMEEEIGTNENNMTDCYHVTSWCKVGFNEIDFGWGKPAWVTSNICNDVPVFMNLVNLMDTKFGEGGIEAWVNIDEAEMKILQANPEILAYASLDPSPLEHCNKYVSYSRQPPKTSKFSPRFMTRNMDVWEGRKASRVLENPGRIASGMMLERFSLHPKYMGARHIWARQKPYQIMFSTGFRKVLRCCPK